MRIYQLLTARRFARDGRRGFTLIEMMLVASTMASLECIRTSSRLRLICPVIHTAREAHDWFPEMMREHEEFEVETDRETVRRVVVG